MGRGTNLRFVLTVRVFKTDHSSIYGMKSIGIALKGSSRDKESRRRTENTKSKDVFFCIERAEL